MAQSAAAGSAHRALALFRTILRLHKQVLPASHRELGDKVVKSEFRAHASAKPEHVPAFMRGWETYCDRLRKQTSEYGRDLRADEERHLNEEQRQKLQELRGQATAGGS